MGESKSLDNIFGIFTRKLFRIPDYQRGYSWSSQELDAFWEDLINLPKERSHYTGQLTLKKIPSTEVNEADKEFWLVYEHDYHLYDVVDGQQRLTTIILLLQSFIELFRSLPENQDKKDDAIFLTSTFSIADIEKTFLFKTPPDDSFRTYKFGYTLDNPLNNYIRHEILGENYGGNEEHNFYTLKLSNGKSFFTQKLQAWYKERGMVGLQEVYRTLTKQLLFNEYIIKDEFDVFVTFETMNNRGKNLSNLELLKNRLIYLTNLYTEDELNSASRKDLMVLINEAWKEVYHQLGRNKSMPLNDDEFLRAHSIMYFSTKKNYIQFLLKEQFTPQSVYRKISQSVKLDEAEENISDLELEEVDENGLDEVESTKRKVPDLNQEEIRQYAKSLKVSSQYWFQTYCPNHHGILTKGEIEWIERLNRLRMVYFRPLLMAILKKYRDPAQRISIFKEIERFIFVVFRMAHSRSTYGRSEFSKAVREIDQGEIDLERLKERLRDKANFRFMDDFHVLLQKKFESGDGYYKWSCIRYFLYEYELELKSDGLTKLDWTDMLKTPNDKISIEHIYPQTETVAWEPAFKNVSKNDRARYRNSLGNLLLLSFAINASLQNDSFPEKKKPKYEDSRRLRAGYEDGSHSEIRVSKKADWGPNEIYERGMDLIRFMEERWRFSFENDEMREKMLFIRTKSDIESN
ncbi:MAG: DUF262 domain-containing protein [Aestuariivita sp.]|nr:DUF262 domain-containing protein [Aestuariivita sp.]